jgi:hypothetical protein
MPRYAATRAAIGWISAVAVLTPTLVLAQTTAPLPQPTAAVSPAFAKGLADRQAWEAWYGGLSGQSKTGAEFWAGQRSLPHPAGCFAAGGKDLGAWSEGCAAAQRLLAPADAQRRSEPDYRLGWNSFDPTQAGNIPPTVYQPPPGPPLASPPPGPRPDTASAPLQSAPQSVPVSLTKHPTLSSDDAAPAVSPAAGSQSCKDDWKQCKDNSDLVNHFDYYYRVQTYCQRAANEKAKYGSPIWPGFWSGGAFGQFRDGTDYVSTGIALAIEKDAQFQNGFGAMVHSTVYCKYDLNAQTVVSVDIFEH